jgi:hypothetical protein
VGWDWSNAPAARHEGLLAYGGYHVVGTYDGVALTLTEAATQSARSTASTPGAPIPDATTPCAEPPGGWGITDPARVRSFDDYTAMRSAAEASPDYAGIWIDEKTPTQSSLVGFGIVNVAFTGNLDVHRRELAALWGGPICVVQRPHPYRELERIRDELSGAEGKRLGLQMIFGGPNDVANRVDAQVVFADAATQRAVDDEFGVGVVHLESYLQPVP